MKTSVLLAGIAGLALSLPAAAAVPALGFTGSGVNLSNAPFTLGWTLTVNTAVTATALGIYDQELDGLANSYQVGLWNSSGGLLASNVVGSGTSGSLVANFRYASISSTLLNPGNYFIGALYLNGTDATAFPNFGGSVTTDPRITYLQSTFAGGGTLTAPTTTFGTPGFFGPNMLIGQVPEPESWAMLIAGFGLIGTAARRRRAAVA